MQRRAMLVVLSTVGALVTAKPMHAVAQARAGNLVVGVLGVGTEAGLAPRMQLFRQALREHGWVGSREVRFVERYADGHYERLPALAAQLVVLKVDLILAAGGSPAVTAAMQATQDIPIVFPTAADPVAQGLVASMARPGGNVTGLSLMSGDLYAKRLELLKEMMPGVRRVGLMWREGNPNGAEFLRVSRVAAKALGMDAESFVVRESRAYEGTFSAMVQGGVQAVLMHSDPISEADLPSISAWALKLRLPLVAGYRRPGVLIAYGTSGPDDFYVRAAYYVDRILKGAKAGELPVEQSTKVELAIDMKTAKALGVTVPKSLLLRADQVIE